MIKFPHHVLNLVYSNSVTPLPFASPLYSYVVSLPHLLLLLQLVRHPEAMLRSLCLALGLPFDPAMLSWPAGSKPYDGVWAPWWYTNTHSATGFSGQTIGAPSSDAVTVTLTPAPHPHPCLAQIACKMLGYRCQII